MKILYHTGQIKFQGGIERTAAIKMNYIADQTPHEAYLVTYEQDSHPFIYPISNRVHKLDLGIVYDSYKATKGSFNIQYLKKIPKHIFRLNKIIKDIKPDVIIVPNIGYEFYFLPFITKKITIVREYHNSENWRKAPPCGFKEKLKRKLINFIEKKYDGLYVLTPEEKEYLGGGEKVHVIPNPVLFPESIIPVERKKKVVSAGRLAPVKQFDKLFEIWSKLPGDLRNEWTLEIYGSGDEKYKDYLQSEIERLQITDSVKLKGAVDDIFSVLYQSSIYVCTSASESFGLAIVEAQYCGLPVISFDCPSGPRNIISHNEDGFLIDLDNNNLYKNYLQKLMNDKDLRKKYSDKAVINAKRFSKAIEKWLSDICSLPTK